MRPHGALLLLAPMCLLGACAHLRPPKAPEPLTVSALTVRGSLAASSPIPEMAAFAQVSSADTDAIGERLAAARDRANGAVVHATRIEGFRVADLPDAAALPPLLKELAPHGPGGDADGELFVEWSPGRAGPDPRHEESFRVTLHDHAYGRIRIGSAEGAVRAHDDGGVRATCGGLATSLRALVPARWETLVPGPAGTARYTVTNAWFDPVTCTARAVERVSVDAVPVDGGALFAFRQPCAACGGRAAVTLLGPALAGMSFQAVGGEATSSNGSFARVSLPVGQGLAASLTARAAVSPLRAWAAAMGAGGDVLPGRSSAPVTLGVEIAQAVGEPEPVAIAYRSNDDPPAATPVPPMRRDAAPARSEER